jgi:hypothetical protein
MTAPRTRITQARLQALRAAMLPGDVLELPGGVVLRAGAPGEAGQPALAPPAPDNDDELVAAYLAGKTPRRA